MAVEYESAEKFQLQDHSEEVQNHSSLEADGRHLPNGSFVAYNVLQRILCHSHVYLIVSTSNILSITQLHKLTLPGSCLV